MASRNWAFRTFIAVLVLTHFVLHLAVGLGPNLPDLLTVAVLLAARRLTGSAAAGLGLGLGLLHDALSLVAFGADAIALTVIGFVGARSRDYFLGETLVFVAGYLALGTWAHEAIYNALLALRDVGREGATSTLLLYAPLRALWSALTGLVALLVYRSLTGER